MKKNLLITLLCLLGVSSLHATLVWYEPFNYTNGGIDLVSTNGLGGTNWAKFSGSSTMLITSNALQISGSRTGEGACRLFTSAVTNTQQPMYASFTLILTNLPSASGTYFTMFEDSPGGDYIGRFFALLGTNQTAVSNTYRLGVSATGAAANKLFPLDMALNTPYQVVIEYDTGNAQADLWVNPISSSDASAMSSDTVSGSLQSKILSNLAFRQNTAAGSTFFAIITNLATANTFDEAATNVWSRTPTVPSILVQPANLSGYVGVSNALVMLATGQSPAALEYQWMQNGTNISNPYGNTNVYPFPSPTTANGGAYSVAVINPNSGLSVTSSVATVSFVVYPYPPNFTSPTANTTNTVYPNANATLSVTASRADSYQWLYNGTPISGATASTLTVNDVNPTSGTIGYYICQAMNAYGTSNSPSIYLTNAYPSNVTISQLRGYVDPVYYLPTNTTSYYTVTGTVVNVTNMAASPNYQLAITDGSAGISVYCYGYAGLITNSPGDVVQVTGPVGIYSSLSEFDIYSTDPSTSITTLSTGNPLPVPTVLPLSFTNGIGYGGVSNALHRFQSTLVTLTNITIAGGGGSNVFASGDYTISDQSGSITMYIYYSFTNIIGTPVPAFCYSLTGVMSEYQSNTATNRSAGYEFWPTDISEIVSTAPAPVTIAESGAGHLSWTPTPYTYSYSVLSSTNVNGPYTPLKTGMIFTNSVASFIDTNSIATNKSKFYIVTSP